MTKVAKNGSIWLFSTYILILWQKNWKFDPLVFSRTFDMEPPYTGCFIFSTWYCLHYDLSQDIGWNIAWALVKSLGLHPRDFPGISPYIPPLVLIQIQCHTVQGLRQWVTQIQWLDWSDTAVNLNLVWHLMKIKFVYDLFDGENMTAIYRHIDLYT